MIFSLIACISKWRRKKSNRNTTERQTFYSSYLWWLPAHPLPSDIAYCFPAYSRYTSSLSNSPASYVWYVTNWNISLERRRSFLHRPPVCFFGRVVEANMLNYISCNVENYLFKRNPIGALFEVRPTSRTGVFFCHACRFRRNLEFCRLKVQHFSTIAYISIKNILKANNIRLT